MAEMSGIEALRSLTLCGLIRFAQNKKRTPAFGGSPRATMLRVLGGAAPRSFAPYIQKQSPQKRTLFLVEISGIEPLTS